MHVCMCMCMYVCNMVRMRVVVHVCVCMCVWDACVCGVHVCVHVCMCVVYMCMCVWYACMRVGGVHMYVCEGYVWHNACGSGPDEKMCGKWLEVSTKHVCLLKLKPNSSDSVRTEMTSLISCR